MKRLSLTVVFLIAPLAFAQTSAPHGASSFERLAKEAQTARDANHIDEAIALYKKGVALKPSWDEGWWFLGTLFYDQDDYPHGRDAFRHVTQLKSDAAVPWAMLGLCEFQTREYRESYEHLRRSLALGIESDQNISDVVHYHYALLLTREAQYEDAMKSLALFAQRGLNQPDYIEAEGLAALRKPLLPLELPPAERELVMDVGRALYDASALKTAQAAAEFKSLVEKYPKEPNIHYLYGSFLLFSDVNTGLAELKKELDLNPNHLPALVTLASEYLRVQDFKAALPYAEKAVDVDPRSFPAHTVLGRVLSEGDIDPARGVKQLEIARQLEPASPQVRMALASAYAKSGRKDDAAKERQEFLKLRQLADESHKGTP